MHPRSLARTLSTVALAGGLAGCSREVLTLGGAQQEQQPPQPDASTPVPVPDADTPSVVVTFAFDRQKNLSVGLGPDPANHDEDNPSLTADLLEIFYTSDEDEGSDSTGDDVWHARRANPDADFENPERLEAVSTDGFDTSPSISPDGLTLWVGSRAPGAEDDDAGDVDIYRFTRPTILSDEWTPAGPETGLNTPYKEIPRPLALDATLMPLGSERPLPAGVDGSNYQTWFARRPNANAAFEPPTVVEELVRDGFSTVDAFLTNDGKILFFNWDGDGADGELYMATRRSLVEKFGTPQQLQVETPGVPGINSDGDERDPWVSPDGSRFYYSSDRATRDGGSQQFDIFEVPVVLPTIP